MGPIFGATVSDVLPCTTSSPGELFDLQLLLNPDLIDMLSDWHRPVLLKNRGLAFQRSRQRSVVSHTCL